MLSNKFFMYLTAAAALLLFVSCGEKDDTSMIDFQNQDYVLKKAKETLGDDVKFAYSGYFTRDSLFAVAAGTEVADQSSWGIKFYLFEIDGSDLEQIYESDLYDGSFNEALIKKIKFPDFDYELLYYNSQDYFMGSGGGEVFSYIIDFDLKNVYYAHLITESDKKISLFISDNTQIPVLKNFFIGNFKRDFPSFTLLSEDKKLDF